MELSVKIFTSIPEGGGRHHRLALQREAAIDFLSAQSHRRSHVSLLSDEPIESKEAKGVEEQGYEPKR
jgi:hypothetical protein